MINHPSLPIHLRREQFSPLPELALLRGRRPVVRVPSDAGTSTWLVTSHALVREVLSDAVQYGSDSRSADAPTRDGVLLTYDPPEHARLRRVLTAGFTATRVRAFEPRIRTIVTEAIDGMVQTGPPAEFVTDFAQPVPATVISELLGVPEPDRSGFRERALVRFDVTRPAAEREAAMHDSRAYMLDLVQHLRGDPADGLLSVLIAEHGHEIDDQELAGVADIVLLGGFDTTAGALTLSTLWLSTDPELADLTQDERALPALVEELLRFHSPVQASVSRIARADTTLGDAEIRAGERLICSLSSANRDESAFAGSDRFDPRRGARRHVAFGHGIHHCIGAPLARAQLRVALAEVFRRLPGLRSAKPLSEVAFHPGSAVHGIGELPLLWRSGLEED